MPPRFPAPPAPERPPQEIINAFCNFAKSGDVKRVAEYLDQYGAAIINERDNMQDTALTWAAWMGQKDVVALLLDRGADINALGMRNRTAVGWAANGSRREVVELLLKRGANAEIRDDEGKTPADLARQQGNPALADYIVETGIKQRKAEFERAAAKKAEEEGAALRRQRLDALKKHKPPKLKP